MHRVVRNEIEAYLDGRLPASVQREVDGHLAACAECRREVAELHKTREWMQELVLPQPIAPGPGFYAKVRQRVEQEAERRVLPFWQLFPNFGRQLAYAALLFVVFLGSYFFVLQTTERDEMLADSGVSAPLVSPPVQREAPQITADTRVNRDRVMRAIVQPVYHGD